MTINTISDVEFGVDLPAFVPDTSLKTGSRFAELAWGGPAARFSDHERARKEGLPASEFQYIDDTSVGVAIGRCLESEPICQVFNH